MQDTRNRELDGVTAHEHRTQIPQPPCASAATRDDIGIVVGDCRMYPALEDIGRQAQHDHPQSVVRVDRPRRFAKVALHGIIGKARQTVSGFRGLRRDPKGKSQREPPRDDPSYPADSKRREGSKSGNFWSIILGSATSGEYSCRGPAADFGDRGRTPGCWLFSSYSSVVVNGVCRRDDNGRVQCIEKYR
mmetsp:Transcript_17357/g.19332  ORF Transcript_17357/g.19332 Transcript_17357/m.19332 type:complete len:190 (-) Transcript_17357:71-640(-)